VQTEADFLKLLAERPDDRALRLVFSDWLMERGDPRGDFIALSLKEGLTARDRDRLARMLEANQVAWLGPLAAVADVHRTRWGSGLLSELVFLHGVTPPQLVAATGDLRLSTVQRLTLPVEPPAPAWRVFLAHPVLKGLRALVAPGAAWRLLAKDALPFALETAGLCTWDVFDDELADVCTVPHARAAKRLELSTMGHLNGLWTPDFVTSVLTRLKSWDFFAEVRLHATYATVEGVAAWLNVGARAPILAHSWPRGRQWSADFAGVVFVLERGADGAFDRLTLDVRGRGLPQGMDSRLGNAQAVLVPLKGVAIKHLEVLTGGAQLKKHERDDLRISARRLRTVETLRIGGVAVEP